MNVVNLLDIEFYVAKRVKYAFLPAPLATWARRAIGRHILRDPARLVRVRLPSQIDADGICRTANRHDLARKFKAGVTRGEEFWMFYPGDAHAEFENEVAMTFDWLQALPKNDRHLRRIDRMSYRQAAELAQDWHARLMRAVETDDPAEAIEETSTVLRLEDGVRIVELLGPAALLREGALMGHCVGGAGYTERVASGKTHIFSLRDADNLPHVTIEVRASSVWQIKGKGNQVPIERWAAPVRSFIKSSGWTIGYDGERIGLISVDDLTTDDPDELLQLLLSRTDADIATSRSRASTVGGLLRNEKVRKFLQWHAASLSREAREDLLSRARPASDDPIENVVQPSTDAYLGAVPSVYHILPTAMIGLLEIGLLQGLEDQVAEALAVMFERIFQRIAARPAANHHIECQMSEFGVAAADGDRILRLMAFAGVLTRFETLRKTAEQARTTYLRSIAASARQMARSHNTPVHDRAKLMASANVLESAVRLARELHGGFIV